MNALIFLCERHDQLTGSASFQDNLLNVLLTPNLPWEATGGAGASSKP